MGFFLKLSFLIYAVYIWGLLHPSLQIRQNKEERLLSFAMEHVLRVVMKKKMQSGFLKIQTMYAQYTVLV